MESLVVVDRIYQAVRVRTVVGREPVSLDAVHELWGVKLQRHVTAEPGRGQNRYTVQPVRVQMTFSFAHVIAYTHP